VRGPWGNSKDSRASTGEDRTEALVHRAQRGEPGALDQLIEDHLPDLRAYVRLQIDPGLRVRESVSDVVQSACREVLEGLPRFEYRGAGSFRAWLFTAALNSVRKKGRFHRAQRRDVAREVRTERGEGNAVPLELYAGLCTLPTTPSELAVAREQAELVERAMDRLPADEREVLLLSRIVGLPRHEVAARMGRSDVAVGSLLKRAIVRLLAALEGRL